MVAPVPQIKALNVVTPEHQGVCGTLAGGGQYTFSYLAGVPTEAAISLAMLVRPQPYMRQGLHPIFEMNLPEGRIREVIRHQLAKAGVIDSMLLLAITGRTAPIGRIRVEAPHLELPSASEEALSLSEILKWKGAGSLYDELEQRYALRSGLSGIQPKVLVPEKPEQGLVEYRQEHKATLPLPDLIVKAGSDEYPFLAINEFVCLSIAKEADIPVPDFYLSEDKQLLVVRRFDRQADGAALGFEDMAVAMDRSTEHKYVGSYELVAKAVNLYSTNRADDLRTLFDMVALSCILGNGDAHLKNFGFLYEAPGSPVRLAPAYDIVCTRAYFPDDELALSVAGSKTFFAARLGLLGFAKECGVEPRESIERILNAAEVVQNHLAGLLEDCPKVLEAMRIGQSQFAKTFTEKEMAARPSTPRP